MRNTTVLGIDVGGSGIKGALVDVMSGEMLTERIRLETPQPAMPDSMAEVVAEIVREFDWEGKVLGCGFPAIVKGGVARSAANIHHSWIGVNIEALLEEVTGCRVHALNDADAAGIAAMQFGAGRDILGTVILITIGSGLGSALFTDGFLVRNTELGHIFLNGMIAEHYASDATRKQLELDWEEWGGRFNQFLNHVERVFSPDLILLGGGGSKKYEFYQEYLHLDTKVIPAKLLNQAGIIGAAFFGYHQEHFPEKGLGVHPGLQDFE
ncbi:MAG: ROK family protein [Saprospiraceae bacterium]|nr:ROK family protein [Saprospiraceae bacterium]